MSFQLCQSGHALSVLWSILLLLLKALVIVWALQLVVFALGASLLAKRSTPAKQAFAAKRADEEIAQLGLEVHAEKPAA